MVSCIQYSGKDKHLNKLRKELVNIALFEITIVTDPVIVWCGGMLL